MKNSTILELTFLKIDITQTLSIDICLEVVFNPVLIIGLAESLSVLMILEELDAGLVRSIG